MWLIRQNSAVRLIVWLRLGSSDDDDGKNDENGGGVCTIVSGEVMLQFEFFHSMRYAHLGLWRLYIEWTRNLGQNMHSHIWYTHDLNHLHDFPPHSTEIRRCEIQHDHTYAVACDGSTERRECDWITAQQLEPSVASLVVWSAVRVPPSATTPQLRSVHYERI